MEAMKFYGWTWQEIMSTPITGFWTCRRHMQRLRCADRIEKFLLEAVTRAEDETRRNWIQEQEAGVGTVIIEDRPMDKEGINTLKNLSQL